MCLNYARVPLARAPTVRQGRVPLPIGHAAADTELTGIGFRKIAWLDGQRSGG
jgi:hypothetical protein